MRHDGFSGRAPAASRVRLPRGDAGFTLVEAAVAVFLVVILIVGLTQALVASLAAQAETRRQEQATVLAIEAIEYARSVPWVELGLDPDANPADPLVITSGPNHFLDGSYVNLPTDELIVEFAGGLISPMTTETLDGQTFVVKTYVTDVDTELRRVTAVAEWVTHSTTRRHQTSTLISEASAP